MAETETLNKWADVQNELIEEPSFPNAEWVEDKFTLFGETLIFKDWDSKTGDNGLWGVVLVEHNGVEKAFSIGGGVATRLEKAKAKNVFPFSATLRKNVIKETGRTAYVLE